MVQQERRLFGCPLRYWFAHFVSSILQLGITGGSASGKTTGAQKIIEDLGVPWVCLLSMDSFYRVCQCTFGIYSLQVLDEKQLELAHSNDFNFDHPGVACVFLLSFRLAMPGLPLNLIIF